MEPNRTPINNDKITSKEIADLLDSINTIESDDEELFSATINSNGSPHSTHQNSTNNEMRIIDNNDEVQVLNSNKEAQTIDKNNKKIQIINNNLLVDRKYHTKLNNNMVETLSDTHNERQSILTISNNFDLSNFAERNSEQYENSNNQLNYDPTSPIFIQDDQQRSNDNFPSTSRKLNNNNYDNSQFIIQNPFSTYSYSHSINDDSSSSISIEDDDNRCDDSRSHDAASPENVEVDHEKEFFRTLATLEDDDDEDADDDNDNDDDDLNEVETFIPPAKKSRLSNQQSQTSNKENLPPDTDLNDNENYNMETPTDVVTIPIPTSPPPSPPHASNYAVDATCIPFSIKKLFDLIKLQNSDYSFVYALSAQLCQDRIPMNCFVNLKMGLLLSLASIELNPDRPPISIITIGQDPTINYLLIAIGQLANRYVGPDDSLKTILNNASYKDQTWINGDPIILANGGVHYIGNWLRLRTSRAEKIFKTIDCSRIEIDNSSRSYPLQTAIWAHWHAFKFNKQDQQAFNKFVKIFGIPIYVEDINNEVLTDFVIDQASTSVFQINDDELSISTDDMRSFLSVISKRKVDLTPKASDLLQKYFVASRIIRPEVYTQQAFIVLKQFSESFAKLSLRHEVLKCDAIAAIYFCENSIQNVFGATETPPPLFKSPNYIGSIDKNMKKFEEWLENYIATYN